MKIEISEDVFQSYAFYAGILVIKMALLSYLTGAQRFAKKVYANPEDASWFKTAKVYFQDDDIERLRRAHLNDVENILPFFVVGLLYCFTHLDLTTANLVFKTFTGARIAHTLVYAVFVLPQPSRGLVWTVGQLCTSFLAFKVITHFG